MPTKNRRVATYVPPDLDENLKKYLAKNPGKSESACLLVLLGMALELIAVEKPHGASVLDRLTALERSTSALKSEVQKINEF